MYGEINVWGHKCAGRYMSREIMNIGEISSSGDKGLLPSQAVREAGSEQGNHHDQVLTIKIVGARVKA